MSFRITDESPKIYLMTVVSGGEPIPPGGTFDDVTVLRSRTWGYHFEQELAHRAIDNNHTDMSELGYYQYAVLSELEPGPCAIPTEIQWYEFIWNYDTQPRKHDGYRVPEFVGTKRIEKPDHYENILFGAF